MTLAAGTRLGPYEISAPIGAGGMGEVYRARDTRLGRDVALKVLPEHLSGSPDLRARFEREAKTISSLNHPHICVLYDVGREGEIDYLVMELLEGETLADRLGKGPLPTEQVLKLGIEITEALDRAHKAGIIHRDLKPANVMLTKAGAKLMDFGLARAGSLGPAASDLTRSPTMTKALTAEGYIVGTFQYMAPEQLEGSDADARTDLWALGCVLYEMATGRRAFEGKSQASLISSVMGSTPPPLSQVSPMSPPALERAVMQCLAKDPEERWQSAGDLRRDLQWIAEGRSQPGSPVPVSAMRGRTDRLAWGVAAVVAVVAVVFGILAVRRPPQAQAPAIRFTIPPPEKASFGTGIALSPDGTQLAFVAGEEGSMVLWIRRLNALEARPFSETTGAVMPFWSPDGRHLGFFADGKLKRIDASDGSIQSIAPVTEPRGGTWSRDGVIVFSPSTTAPLMRVTASGGEPTPVTALDMTKKESSHRWPSFLPDGKHFLYLARSGDKEAEAIYLASLDGGERQRLVQSHSSAAFAAPGYLLFVRDKTLTALPFDLGSLKVSGESFSVAQNAELIGENGPSGLAPLSIANNGMLAYLEAGSTRSTELIWVDRSGRLLQKVAPPAYYDEPTMSPDGKRVAINVTDPKSRRAAVWLLDAALGKLSRFTFGESDDSTCAWSPDGSRIVYASNRKGFWDLYSKQSSGLAAEEPLLTGGSNRWPDDWSMDGRFIVYEDNDQHTRTDLWILPMTGDRKPRPYLQTEFNEAHAQVSPDGRWLAYGSDESGRSEIYVQTFPTPGGKYQISTEGGDQPLWRRDGKELFYVSAARKLTSVEVSTGASFEAGIPKPLFGIRTPPSGLTGARIRYAAAADGQRFLVVASSEEVAAATPLDVILNWTADLKR